MLELILVRHGETDSSKSGRFCGWTDSELNENGIRQAVAARDKLKGRKVDVLYSSPLKRAFKTAEIINENFGLGIICRDELKERNFGIWENLTHEEISQGFENEYLLWCRDWINYSISRGESALQFYERVSGFINKELLVRHCGTILIVSHLGCIRSMLAYLMGMGIEGQWRFRADSGGISCLTVNDEGYAYMTALNI